MPLSKTSLLRLCPVAAVAALLVIACSETVFFPSAAFSDRTLPPREPGDIEIVFGDGVPSCDYEEMGTIVTEKAPTETLAVDTVRNEAARIGATGVFNMQSSDGGVLGMGASSATPREDISVKAQAFVCKHKTTVAPDTSAAEKPKKKPKSK